ncbi:MAG: DUF3098 domain-containing protein [Cytophagaceae bacterium]|jgi:hypothetical protein
MKNKLIFEKINYILMLAGLAVLILGFILMTQDTAAYGFGTMGLTVGPIIVFLGFIIQFFAILYKPKSKE